MSVNGKLDDFVLDDLLAFGKTVTIKKARARTLIDQVKEGLKKWRSVAEKAEVSQKWAEQIENAFREL